MRTLGTVYLLGSLLTLPACKREASDSKPPPRATDTVKIHPQASLITVPIKADLGNLTKTLEREIPKILWSIDKPQQPCVPSKKVDIGIAKLKTPTIRCRIVGQVQRGALQFSGKGHEILVTMPLHAEVRAEDIGGILKRETARADAMAHAVITVDLNKDWSPRGKVSIRYDWTNAPHLMFLGQRIDFTEQADAKLAPVIARLERQLPGELGKLHVRQQVAAAWRSAFTTLSLNKENPPVWMRVTPQEIQYGGYELSGKDLTLRLGLKAVTETFVGQPPERTAPTPLPAMQPLSQQAGQLQVFIPVMAQYDQLEPVLARALQKRSARPFDVPGVGPVMAQFDNVTIYGTTNSRIAVGLTFTAQDAAKSLKPTKGTVWMTALPVNQADSRKVAFSDFQISGTTDMTGGDLILQLANTPVLSETLSGALTQNFEKDYADLLRKIDRAISHKSEGNFLISADIQKIRTGEIKASGQGLFLPVWASGTAAITLSP